MHQLITLESTYIYDVISIAATILNNTIFTSNGHYACLSESTTIINKINGNLDRWCERTWFYDCSVTLTNGVGGNVHCRVTSISS